MRNKIHPHIKHFIKSSIITQVSSEISKDKKQMKWLENIISIFQEELLKKNLEDMSVEEYQKEVDAAGKTALSLIEGLIKTSSDSFKSIPPSLWK